jgi:hypothetical protein
MGGGQWTQIISAWVDEFVLTLIMTSLRRISMRKTSILVTIFFMIMAMTLAVIPGNAMAATEGWELIYKHDASGSPTYGSITDLRDAILSGADVKIVFSHAGGDTSIVGNMAATILLDGHVTLYSKGIVNCPNNDDIVHYLDRFTTDGLRQVTQAANTCGKNSWQSYFAMDWYIRR